MVDPSTKAEGTVTFGKSQESTCRVQKDLENRYPKLMRNNGVARNLPPDLQLLCVNILLLETDSSRYRHPNLVDVSPA